MPQHQDRKKAGLATGLGASLRVMSSDQLIAPNDRPLVLDPLVKPTLAGVGLVAIHPDFTLARTL